MTTTGAALRGRRELALLAQPSVQRMAAALARRCRDISWIRTTVASLDRFATLTENQDLEALLERSRRHPHEATAALDAFALALDQYAKSQIAALAMAPKIWLALNGVSVPWRPLLVGSPSQPLHGKASLVDRLVLLALVGSGLHRAELLRVRLGDLGSLDAYGEVVNDIDADPLVVRFVQQRGKRQRITFLSDHARDAVHALLAQRSAQGELLGPHSVLVATSGRAGAESATFERSRRRNSALIEAGNSVNVELCRATGRFFREWGAPGARFSERMATIEESL
ncbi:MAG: hypothetical protein NVSMB64_24180 [Candidatus Velthaea sp.]